MALGRTLGTPERTSDDQSAPGSSTLPDDREERRATLATAPKGRHRERAHLSPAERAASRGLRRAFLLPTGIALLFTTVFPSASLSSPAS